MTLVLETLRSDEALDTGCFGIWFLVFALGFDFAADDEFADLIISHQQSAPIRITPTSVPSKDTRRKEEERGTTMRTRSSTHIIILAQAKELANLSRPLGPQSLRQHLIRESRHLILPLLHHTQRQHRQIHRRNAPPHTLPLSLPGPPGPVAAVSRTQQQADSSRMHNALLHGETLLVVAAGDLEDVAFEFGADAVAFDFLAHALVHEAAEFAVVFDIDELLGAVGWVGDVELHLDGGGWGVKMMEVCWWEEM